MAEQGPGSLLRSKGDWALRGLVSLMLTGEIVDILEGYGVSANV